MRLRHFLDFLFPLRSDEKIVCGIETSAFLELLRPELVPETRPGTASLLPFHRPEVRAVLHEAKYHGNPRSFELLGLALREYLADLDLMRAQDVSVVPIPLGRARQKERGFNQVEEVVKYALRELPFRLEPALLVRVRDTASQVSLPRHEREKNMRGAFLSADAVTPASTYLLVDDVITTGATLQAAVTALTEAGATYVIPIALAH